MNNGYHQRDAWRTPEPETTRPRFWFWLCVGLCTGLVALYAVSAFAQDAETAPAPPQAPTQPLTPLQALSVESFQALFTAVQAAERVRSEPGPQGVRRQLADAAVVEQARAMQRVIGAIALEYGPEGSR